jgi:hypothetical protein
LLKRVSTTVVFTTGYFADGTGAVFSPREAAAAIAKARKQGHQFNGLRPSLTPASRPS